MIEAALFVGLGFCTAVVFALALLPLLWARALRLTRQRLELLVPWSKGEIDAERDGLRAQAAVRHRHLEQTAERSQAMLATRDIELGRRTVDLVQREVQRDALRQSRAALVVELADLGREMRDAEGQRFAAEKALHDADHRIETDAAAARAQAARYDRLLTISEGRRGTVAALETKVAGLSARLEDRADAFQRLQSTLDAAQASQSLFSEEHARLVAAHTALEREHEAARRALAEERGSAIERERRLLGRTEFLAAAEARITEQDASMKHKDDRFEALQQRFDTLMTELAARRDDGVHGAAEDARLRASIVAAGDDALRLLIPEPDTAGSQTVSVEHRRP